MTPFRSATFDQHQLDKAHRQHVRNGGSVASADALVASMRTQTIYRNDVYQVQVTPVPAGHPCGPRNDADMPSTMVWLSIKRNNRQPIHDWRELQAIKDAILGPECEAVELYPAASRLNDGANQYHLWGFTDPAIRFPFGYPWRDVADKREAAQVGAKQRPFAKE
jgi:hypothetical protein